MDKSFSDFLNDIYQFDYPNSNIRNITFQVTDDCCCNCSYCYQTNKGHNYMTQDIAKQIIDLLFQMYDNNKKEQFINKNTIGLILDFIGGEPLMNLPIIDYICTYFMENCLEKNHIWLNKWKASMISNGAKYFETNTQNFLNKFNGFVSFDITLDGPKEIHDKCRKYHNGKGNFDDAYKAFKDCQKRFGTNSTKVTIAPENLNNINDIIDFFINENINKIYANPIYEHNWTISEAKIFYKELIKIADKLLNNCSNLYCSLFDELIGQPILPTELQTWCGGTGKMLAFDPYGIAYPCLRYMNSSLNNEQPPLIIGNSLDGIYNNKNTKKIYEDLLNITRRSQSSDECFNCSYGSGCSSCAAWNYQLYGTPNSRCTYICNMHKVRVLANCYYWNLYYNKNNINRKFKLYISKNEALKFISEDEYNLLIDLIKK